PFLLIKWTVQIIKWIIQVIEKANQNKKEQELYNKQEKLRIEENKHQQELRNQQERLRIEEYKHQQEIEKERKATEEKYQRDISLVKDTSPLYANVLNLNKKYSFDNSINSINTYKMEYLSKASLDKVDFERVFITILSENEQFFEAILSKINFNIKLWREYQSKYNKLEHYAEESKNEELSLVSYNSFEKILFKQEKLDMPIIRTCIQIFASYTSPTGQNYYKREKIFSQKEVVSGLEKMRVLKEQQKKEEEESHKAKEETLVKMRRLREIDKIEAQLTKKQNEIAQKEKEFLIATQDHIYSTELKTEIIKEEKQDSTLTPYEQLKKLKQKLDDCEIDIEEYTQKRKEIMAG
ncbi:MAG: hypothetical protein WCX32_01380, partial [Clostridia bacterium]